MTTDMRSMPARRMPRGSGALWTLLSVVVLAGCTTTPDRSPEQTSMTDAPSRTVRAMPGVGPLSPEPRTWAPTVDEAVHRAIAHGSEINVLRAAVQVAEQRKRAATDITDPELEMAWGQDSGENLRSRWSTADIAAQGASERTSPGFRTEAGNTTDSGDGWRINARFFIPNPWLVIPRLDARKAEIHACRADLRAAEWRVTCDVRRLFAVINYLALDLAAAEALVRLDGDIRNAVQSRGERGAATAADVVSASRRHLQAQDNLDRTRQSLRVAQRELAAALNVAPETLHVGTNTAVIASLPRESISVDRAEGIALQCRADVAALRWRMLAAKAAYDEACNVRLPWVKEVNASCRSVRERTRGSETMTGSGEYRSTGIADRQDSEEWWVGLSVDVPIFSWVKNHGQDVLLAKYKLAGVNETEGVRRLRNELRGALDELDECRRLKAHYDNDMAPAIVEMRRTLVTMRNAPTVMPDQLAAAEMQFIESLRIAIGVRQRCRLALIDLNRAIGAPLGEMLKP